MRVLLCLSLLWAYSEGLVAQIDPALQARWDSTYRLARFTRVSNPRKALSYANDALEAARKMGHRLNIGNAWLLRAEIAELDNRINTALVDYDSAHVAFNAVGAADARLSVLEKLETLHIQQGNYKAGHEWGKQRAAVILERTRNQQAIRQQQWDTEREALRRKRNWEMGLLSAVSTALLIGIWLLFRTSARTNRRLAGAQAEKKAVIEDKRRRTEQLLHNILPKSVATELAIHNKVLARRYEHATVMFIDFVDFTKTAEQLSPEELVEELDRCFSRFDDIMGRYRIEKIKTVGDAYLCASGLSDGNEHPGDMIQAALAVQEYLGQLRARRMAAERPAFEARIGIHHGPVVAGVIGAKKFSYDIWGDTVNIAARMEQACEAGRVNVSSSVQALAADAFSWEYRGNIAAKNKAELAMYYVGEP